MRSRDEFGDLTVAFNDMSRNLAIKEELLTEQRRENDRLMLSLMPEPVVQRYREGEETIAQEDQDVTVIFADITGLDDLSTELSSDDLLAIVNKLTRQFDAAAENLGVDQVRTLHNGYLASCGMSVPRGDNVRRTVDFAIEMQRIIDRFNSETGNDLKLRAGIDTGTVTSGLVGRSTLAYDMWGSAVNLAYQVQSGAPQAGVYVTSRVYDAMQDTLPFTAAGEVVDDGKPEPIWRLAERQPGPASSMRRGSAGLSAWPSGSPSRWSRSRSFKTRCAAGAASWPGQFICCAHTFFRSGGPPHPAGTGDAGVGRGNAGARRSDGVRFRRAGAAALGAERDPVQGAPEGTWRKRIPSIFLDVARFALIAVGVGLVFAYVWVRMSAGCSPRWESSRSLGLALQNSVGQIISGLLVLFEQPFQLGDWIDTPSARGRVVEVNWRATHIDTVVVCRSCRTPCSPQRRSPTSVGRQEPIPSPSPRCFRSTTRRTTSAGC